MREAIYIPVIHTQTDMGTMAESLKMEYIVKYGKKGWEQHIKAIDDMWDGLNKKLFKLKLPYKKVRIYQNSLPVCGKELEMVQEMATKGSPNYKIIINLVKKGAKLEGTEDPKLLMEEYNNLKMLFKPSDSAKKIKVMEKYERMGSEIIIKRDKFIAGRIDNTLLDKEVGIIFMGVHHTVDKYLDNIKISYLIHRMPFRESYDEIKGRQ